MAQTPDPAKAAAANASAEPAGRLLCGRYRVTSVLRQRPATQTLLVRDSFSENDPRDGDGAHWLLAKCFPAPSHASALLAHKRREAAALASLEGQPLVAWREAALDQERLFLVRPFIDGQTLEQRLEQGPLTLDQALLLGARLLAALAAAHGAGVLHGALRPANVILPDEHVEQAVLVDFGQSATLAEGASPAEQRRAAWHLSPEQAGSLDCEIGPAADLYSAGAVLFHCLAGRPPFDAETAGGVLHQHITARVPELGAEAPRALDELLSRLMRKHPRDRYQSAEAVLADWNAIAAAIAVGEAEPAIVVGSHDRRRTLTEPAFVGRAEEVARIDEQLALAAAGDKRLMLLEAESGGGKSRLLAEAARRAIASGAYVLRGQGQHQVGQRPCQILDGVAADLATLAASDAALAQAVRSRVGDQAAAICAALPRLAELLEADSSEILGPESFGENRTLHALAVLLDALGAGPRPALVILDDCQWADELSLKLLAHWQRRREEGAPARRLLAIAAFRGDEAAADHPLRALPVSGHVKLSPFSPGDVRRLVESMAGPLPDEAVDAVVRLSEGSPFMASAVLRGLVESGALLADAEGWRIEPLAMADLQSSSHAAAFLSRRIDLLPASTAHLLMVGAVLGKEFDLEAAAPLAGQDADEALAALEEARRRQLVWARRDSGRFLFVHDRLRAAFLERLSENDRRRLHLAAARRIEALAPGKAFDLAYHYDAAGDSKSALAPALVAAEQARAQHALAIAEQQYRIAQRGADLADRSARFRIAHGLGDVLMLRGRYDEASEWFAQASQLAEGRLAEAQIRCKLGELAFKRGDMEAATAAFEQSLRLLGAVVPRRLPGFVAMLLFEAVVQLLHTALPRLLVARRRREPRADEVLSWRVFSRLAHGYWFTRGKVHVLWTHIRGMNLAERYRPTLELAQAYSEHAPAMSLIPLYARGISYARKSLEIRRALGDLWGQGQSLHYYGVVLYTASRFAECIDKCREAVRLLERTGDYWEVHIARYQIAAAYYRLGDLPAAIEEARKIYRSGVELGDEQASGISLDVWSRATGGALPAEVIGPELSRTRHDAQGFAQVMLAEGVRLIGADQPQQAAEVFQKALAAARKAGVMNTYVAPNLAWLTTALRMQAERYAGYAPGVRRALLRRARRAGWASLLAALRFQNDLPHALRELGLVGCLLGHSRLARLWLWASARIARRQYARFELAQSLVAYGAAGAELRWPLAEQRRQEGEAELRALAALSSPEAEDQQAPATLSLVDRFDVVLQAGRAIALALTQSAIFRELEAAAVRLLRAQDCLIVDVAGDEHDPRLSIRSPEKANSPEAPLALAAAAGCLAARRATAVTGGEAETSPATADSSAERSALAAPIFVRGRVAACFYVVHRRLSGLFGSDEERIADFIATIAGAALENAEGFEQLQELNITLEQRVADRTAAAESRARELAASNEQLARIAAELKQTEEQLRVAMAAADSANQAKSRFLAAMSHEIRSPLNGITGMTELALATRLTQQQKTYLNIVKQSADALLRLLNDILDLSKIEAGKLELEEIPFDLHEVVGDAVQVMAARACEKRLDLAFRVAPQAPARLRGDPGRLRQILVNLIGNAIKFTERGEVIVEASLDSESEPENRQSPSQDSALIRFSVRDTGIGIPADKQSRLFAAFSQADSSTTRRYGGTGLGLAISRQLVELMHGQIGVESEPGRGSRFHFSARFQLDHQPQQALAATPASGMRALVVDDHEPTRRFCREVLASRGLSAADCDGRDAEEEIARALAEGRPYQILLCDAEMGEVDGPALMANILQDSRLSDCRLFALLPAGNPEVAARCRELGIVHFLTKPAKPDELFAAIESTLQPETGDGDAPPAAVAEVRPLSILLAEDGLVNQEVAIGLLEMRGHRVTAVENGREAVETIARQSFDLVLMDLEMPEMDGMSATRAIRLWEQQSDRRTPIIAMTAHAIKGFREQCLAAGMDDYISKPIQPQELFAAVERAGQAGGLGHDCAQTPLAVV